VRRGRGRGGDGSGGGAGGRVVGWQPMRRWVYARRCGVVEGDVGHAADERGDGEGRRGEGVAVVADTAPHITTTFRGETLCGEKKSGGGRGGSPL